MRNKLASIFAIVLGVVLVVPTLACDFADDIGGAKDKVVEVYNEKFSKEYQGLLEDMAREDGWYGTFGDANGVRQGNDLPPRLKIQHNDRNCDAVLELAPIGNANETAPIEPEFWTYRIFKVQPADDLAPTNKVETDDVPHDKLPQAMRGTRVKADAYKAELEKATSNKPNKGGHAKLAEICTAK